MKQQRQVMPVPISGAHMMNEPPPNLPMPPNMPPNMQHNMPPNMPQIPGMRPMSIPMNLGPPQPSNWSADEVDRGAQGLTPLMSVKVDKPTEMKTNKATGELILPKALEDVLKFKDQLAGEMGRVDGEVDIEKSAPRSTITTGVISTDYADADAESDDDEGVSDQTSTKDSRRLNKNKKKKQRKKQNKKNRHNNQQQLEEKQSNQDSASDEKENRNSKEDYVAIEYVPEKVTVADLAPIYRQFYRVFELFKLDEKPTVKEEEATDDKNDAQKKDKDKLLDDEDEDMDEDKTDDKEKLSKRKLKKLTRLSVAELKQLVNRPDVVEMHDVTARDPKLLVQLKAHRNTVQVPRHWCFKRKYLQGKRGIEKPPFDLPAFIKKTGIMEMRASLQEKDEAKTLKAKMRERARPKMGKIDIDYQKLHDAFFK